MSYCLLVNSPTEQGPELQPTHSPITTDFCPPESSHFRSQLQPPRSDFTIPFRSRSPSLAGSDSKSTRPRPKSMMRARSLLCFFSRKEEHGPSPLSSSSSDLASPVPPPPPPLTTDEANERRQVTSSTLSTSSPTPTPTSPRIQTLVSHPQRKKTIFARFKRSNTALPSSPAPKEKDSQRQPPSRSKSLFASVRKTVVGSGANTNPSALSELNNTTTNLNKVNEDTLPVLPSLPSFLPSVPSNSNPPSSELALPTATPTDKSDADSATPTPKGPIPDAEVKDHAVGVEEEESGFLSSDPFGSSADVDQPQPGQSPEMGKTSSCTSLRSSKSEYERSPEQETEKRPSVSEETPPSPKGTGKRIGISLILNRERKPSTPSLSPASPISSLSPPTSPTSPTWSTSPVRLRGKLGRRGTSGTEGLLSFWGGVSGLLGGGGGGGEGINEEVVPERQALQPTIYKEGNIMLNTSHIEDEEMRRVTEVAFM